MRKIIAGFAISLDGYMEGPEGEYDWIYTGPDQEFDAAVSPSRFDTFLMGRITYEKVIPFNDPSFLQYHNFVFSKTLQQVNPGFVLVRDDPATFITQLKSRPGKDIALYGGANLLTSFLNLNLVDEISMSIIPVLLGSGKPMINALEKRTGLDLKDIRRFANGNVLISYKVEKTTNR